ncbi:kinase-like protein [Clathrospora elynae]|uniref:Kinase-like protein n=1 Tax=Clathrospora elynae TaxID=706981 RepID=A0A6A5T8G7_9PLEO|nr:kinase-like protein [Clathrospora elynae]
MTTRAHINELTDFFDQTKRWRRFAIDESSPKGLRPFIPIHELRNYLIEARLRKLLLYVHRSPNEWRGIRDSYLAVFAILLTIEKGAYISHFTRYDRLADSRLPLSNPDEWPEDCKSFFEAFDKAQREYCAKRLENGRLNDTSVPENTVMPFIKKEVLKKGPDSTVFRVEVHPDYNFLTRDDHNHPTTNFFVLKSCRADRSKFHNNEVEAYKALSSQTSSDDVLQNIARFYGSWTQGDTCNMLLEYVGGDTLTRFFESNEPPTTEEDILKFWRNFIQIARPIARLHRLPDPQNTHSYKQGLHNDIKPDNILISEKHGESRFDVSYKLADLGLTGFVLANEVDEEVHLRDVHGTQMYSAPEYYHGENNRLAQQSITRAKPSKDIWSLACVFSEAAVWSVFGPTGFRNYRIKRAEATNNITALKNTAYSGCFHDGEKFLDAVRHMHDDVIRGRRTGIDNVVDRVVWIIEGMMKHEASRPDALKVHEDLTRALEPSRTPRNDVISPPPQTTPLHTHHTHHTINRQIPPILPDGLGLSGSSPLLQSPISVLPNVYTGAGVSSTLPLWGSCSPEPDRHQSMPSTASPDFRYLQAEGSLDNHHGQSGLSRRPSLHSTQSPLLFPHGPSRPTSGNFETAQHIIPGVQSNLMPASNRFSAQQNALIAPADFPTASVDDVLKWISKKKVYPSTVLPGQEWLKRLHGRDQIFLIDDSQSMKQHWKSVKRVFEALAYLVKGMDQDGIDLCFTNNCSEDGRDKDRKRLIKNLDRVRPGGQCQMGIALSKILPKCYPDHAEKRASWYARAADNKPGVNIYIFTDGVWSNGPDHLCGVQEHIKLLVDKLVEKGRLQHVGIEFIRFGDDGVGKQRLSDLDDGLGKYNVQRDIVDTEPATGNVFKMLLGSTDSNWDVLHSR